MTTVIPPSRVRQLQPNPASMPRYKAATAPLPAAPKHFADRATRNRVVRPEYQQFLFSAVDGETILRILPPHADSLLDSAIYTFKVYDLAPRAAGAIPEIAVPASLSGVPAVADDIEVFARFLQANCPQLLHTPGSAADTGLSLWGKDRAVCALYISKSPAGLSGQCPVRIWYASNYAGNNALRPGVLRTLGRLCTETVPTVSGKPRLRFGDISHPLTGRNVLLSIDRSPTKGYQFDRLQAFEETRALEVDERVFAAHPDYHRVNRPLEQLIHCPSAAELRDVLEDYVCWQVRHGYVQGDLVFSAYAQCFGREIPLQKRAGPTAGSIAPPPVDVPVVHARIIPPPAAAPVNPAGKPRITDDLDGDLSTVLKEVAALQTASTTPDPVAMPVEATKGSSATATNDEAHLQRILQRLRAIKTINPIQKAAAKEECEKLRAEVLWKFASKLSIADLDLIDGLADQQTV